VEENEVSAEAADSAADSEEDAEGAADSGDDAIGGLADKLGEISSSLDRLIGMLEVKERSTEETDSAESDGAESVAAEAAVASGDESPADDSPMAEEVEVKTASNVEEDVEGWQLAARLQLEKERIIELTAN